MRFFPILALGILLITAPVLKVTAEDWPIELKIALSHSNTLETKNSNSYNGFGFPYFGLPDSVNGGFGVSLDFRYKFTESFRVAIKIGYDYTYLFQDDVLEEWNWDYWEKTYIEFLPGLTVEEANSTLQYNAETDTTQFSAVFIPTQRLKELKISLEAGYHLSLSERFTATFGLEFGASLFYRELRMEEKWIKRFKLDTLTTDEYDYEYRFDLLHFAPSKKGTRIYLAPSAGLNYYLDQNFDLELDIIYTQYLSHSQIGWLEDLLGVPKDSEKWFPVDSKFLIRFGLIFKY